MRIIIYLIILFALPTKLSAENNYYLMLKNNKVNVRYGPSFEYPIKFVYKKKFFPVKIIDKKENFRRIIDHKKNSGWIHISQLQKSKSIITLKETSMFKKSSKFSRPIVKIEEGRLLLIKKCDKFWCKVISGEYSGWIETKEVWGRN